MTEKFIVYMATNTVNGKRYIGATRKGINGRRNQHFKDARRKGAAGAAHHLSASTIWDLCHSSRKTQSGLSFSYLDEWCPNPE